jgi:hypothetical protein
MSQFFSGRDGSSASYMDAQYRGNCMELIKSLVFQVLLCTKEMVKGTLNSALAAEQPDLSDVEVNSGPQLLDTPSITSNKALTIAVFNLAVVLTLAECQA